MTYAEYNFDGLIGPTHNYAGLSFGNLASAKNAGAASNPKEAALQGLAKMREAMGLGLKQGFLPPHDRPHLKTLRALGFSGTDKKIIESAARTSPEILANCYAASPMWTANAGTVAPSPDTLDKKAHFTAANLAANFHRAIEADVTARVLAHIFDDDTHFVHHPPLPGGMHFGDEGAANHGRLCENHGQKGVHLFVFGEDGEKFPARQKLRASEAVARNHRLDPAKTVFLKQSGAALDAGAFHNDVVGVANGTVLFLHEESFADKETAYREIREAAPFVEIIEATAKDVSLEDCINSYLFNSQLLTLPGGEMALLLPVEAGENPRVKAFVDETLSKNNPINRAIYKDVRESMRNGGGPACLRLRVVLSEEEAAAANPNFILDEDRITQLEHWVKAHYRDRLTPDDLADPALMEESLAATQALTDLLSMGAFYDFQR
ncbi:N-succinylarginine dihydrolase [Hyphococcus luteus]|uniref:N-succinylarginine dihydrolase n=1 Tax=Hyphococcus luteus TaxID=2058213 RepID=A0A2S7JZ59_9PROT|nr:N-succinylarginine dihydrolase [Marinicaulis flavus]PQA85496.1 N-succinylarginine dihydrolase [Marinicaulis flavus]